MTLEDGDSGGGFQLVDFSLPERSKPLIHQPVDPPLCETCQSARLQFFDPNCDGCQELLLSSNTTIPEIFAILRQWTPQTQQNLEMLIREILKRGAHVNDRDGLTDMTMLHYVAKAGVNGMGDMDESCRMANLLVSKGADVFIRCRWTNMTALHYAAYFDVAPVMKILLKASKGVDIDSPCTEFEKGTPLHIAASNLSLETTKVLLQNGANTGIKDDLGRTPLDRVSRPDSYAAESDTRHVAEKLKKVLEEAPPPPVAPGPVSGDSTQSSAILQSTGLQLGDKVVVGGMKTGTLRYCGVTDFAAGLWAGIELDETAGKNDGSVGGVGYFKCKPKHGIFAPLSKISKAGILTKSSTNTPHTPLKHTTSFGKVDTSRVTAKVDTGSAFKAPPKGYKPWLNRSASLGAGSSHAHDISLPVSATTTGDLDAGDKVTVAGQRKGVIRYSGETDFAPGWWYGIELDRPSGKNDGSVSGKRYFTCKPKYGVFAPPARVQKCAATHGSRESLDSLTSDKHRRLSVGSAGSGSLTNISGVAKIKSAIAARPKSSGGSMKRSFPASTPGGKLKLQEGISVFCNNELGVLRYNGTVEFADGIWLGIELRTPKGKNDGSVQGKRYFSCKPNHGLLVRPSKVTVRGINAAKLIGDAGKNTSTDATDKKPAEASS